MPTTFIALLLSAGVVQAEVTDKAATGFTSVHHLTIKAPPSEVYGALTDRIGQWWDAAHSYSGAAANFSMDARAGGCFCERLPGGGSVEHMRVVFADPGRMLRLNGGLGPLQSIGVAGAMSFTLSETGQGTRLDYRYVVGGHYEDGLDTLAEPVDRVQLGQLQRLKRYVETGTPELP
jgi:uncharacterized protein YndB with AHSA1/START domain